MLASSKKGSVTPKDGEGCAQSLQRGHKLQGHGMLSRTHTGCCREVLEVLWLQAGDSGGAQGCESFSPKGC